MIRAGWTLMAAGALSAVLMTLALR
jgi:hypothetical protein